MYLEVWDPERIQNGMPMRLSKELFHEAPTDAHILWTYQSPWKDARLRHNVSSTRILLNHIPGTNVLTRKLLLPRLLRSESLTSLAPLTFLLPQERARFETARRRNHTREWLFKGAHHGNIRLLPQRARLHLSSVPALVQERISPLLLNGTHHFDVGIYALLAPDGSMFTYDEILLRIVPRTVLTVGKGYLPAWDAASPLAPFMPECRSSAACALKRVLGSQHKHILERMRSVVSDLLKATLPHTRRVTQRFRERSTTPHSLRFFEMLRFDFLIDVAYRIWLIEVNASPSTIPMHDMDEKMKYTLLKHAICVAVHEGKEVGKWSRSY